MPPQTSQLILGVKIPTNSNHPHPLSRINHHPLSIYADVVSKNHYLQMQMQIEVLRYANAVNLFI
jgi:hypothetical protein